MSLMEMRVDYKKLSVFLLILSVIFAGLSFLFSISLHIQRIEFFREENVIYEEFSVQMRDGAVIKGVLYAESKDYERGDSSIPSILMLNGINSRKEDHLEWALQLVKYGYAVFSVEQRGHGESTGPSAFIGKEPEDMIEVLDHIEKSFKFANTSHMGLLGFSFGGGIGAILQAEEERIYASVLFHPLSDLSGLLERIPFQYLIGKTLAIEDLEEVDDAFDVATPNNTRNLLLIHGTEDTLILPKESEDFYEHLDGEKRNDIELELRPNLDHGQNEENLDSLRYALLWFEHFYHDPSLKISESERSKEIKKLELEEFTYPDYILSELMIIFFGISLFIAFSILIIKYKILPKWEDLPLYQPSKLTEEDEKRYKKMILYRSIAYILPIFIVGPLMMYVNPSFLFGYFLVYPLITLTILMFIPSELHKNWREEWKEWLDNDAEIMLYCLGIILIPILLILFMFNLNTRIMLKPQIPFVNLTFLTYIFMGFSSVVLDFMYLREWKPRHTFFLIGLRPLSMFLFILFVPIEPFPYLGGLVTMVIFILLTGVIFYYIRQFGMGLSKFYKTHVCLYGLIFIPAFSFFMYIFFQIL